MPAFDQRQTDTSQRRQTNIQRYLVNRTLLNAGFKRVEGSLLWKQNGVCYGREAALQNA